MAGDDDRLAALDLIEDLRQMRFRLRGPDLAHDFIFRLVDTVGKIAMIG